jgi:RHS repeat-associated protein
MASVTNEGYDGSGVLNSRERTSYEYDSKSFRVKLTNENDSLLDGNYAETSTTEFLADHHNHTGYTQTIRETTTENGLTLTTDYTFGHDEIAQRKHGDDIDGNNVEQTLVFGHDGHGSVRVLYDLSGTAATIAQALTFAAYGQMLAVHGSTGGLVGTNAADALTSLGYSGEHFDAKAQQQYLRARFYNPSNGQFNRLDPFAGNTQDPQSLHKYAYVHGDPIQGVDPSGEFFVGLALFTLRTSRELGAAAAASTALSAALGGLGGFATYTALDESPWVGAYNGALIGAGLRVAYLTKGTRGLYDAFLDGTVTGVSRVLTELAYACGPGTNDARTNSQILRAAALKGADSFAAGLWSSSANVLGKPKWLQWANSPLGSGILSGIDSAITSVWGDINRTPVPPTATIVENAVVAGSISVGSSVFKKALADQFPDVPDEMHDDIQRAVLNVLINAVVGFDAKGISGFVDFFRNFHVR